MTTKGHTNGSDGLWQPAKTEKPLARAKEAEDVSNANLAAAIIDADSFHSS